MTASNAKTTDRATRPRAAPSIRATSNQSRYEPATVGHLDQALRCFRPCSQEPCQSGCPLCRPIGLFNKHVAGDAEHGFLGAADYLKSALADFYEALLGSNLDNGIIIEGLKYFGMTGVPAANPEDPEDNPIRRLVNSTLLAPTKFAALFNEVGLSSELLSAHLPGVDKVTLDKIAEKFFWADKRMERAFHLAAQCLPNEKSREPHHEHGRNALINLSAHGKEWRRTLLSPLSLLATGLTCPDTKCEKSCTTKTNGDGAVSIRSIEGIITEWNMLRGRFQAPPVEYDPQRVNFSVSIIGAGPAGIALAEQLLKKGVRVTMYGEFGGELSYGLPPDKLQKIRVKLMERLLKKYPHFTHDPRMVGTEDGQVPFSKVYEQNDRIRIMTGHQVPNSLHESNVKSGWSRIFQGKGWLKGYNQAYTDAQDLDTYLDQCEAEGSIPPYDPNPDFIPRSVMVNGEEITPESIGDGDVMVWGGGDTAMDGVRDLLRFFKRWELPGKVIVAVRGDFRASHEEQDAFMQEVKAFEKEGGVMLSHCGNNIQISETGDRLQVRFENSEYPMLDNVSLLFQSIGQTGANYPVLFGDNRLKLVDGHTAHSDHADDKFRRKVGFAGDLAQPTHADIVSAWADGQDDFREIMEQGLGKILKNLLQMRGAALNA